MSDPSVDSDKNQARRPKWISKYSLEHETETPRGTLQLKRRIDVDGQTGATLFAVPGRVVPRIDITARTSLFLSAPGHRPFLVGFLPRVRASFLVKTRYFTEQSEQQFSGFSVALGGCYTPYYQPDGFGFFLCADYGGGYYYLDAFYDGDRPEVLGDIHSAASHGVAKLSASIEVEYNIASFLHLPVRVGYEGNMVGTYDYLDDDGLLSQRLGRATIFMTAGLGLHF